MVRSVLTILIIFIIVTSAYAGCPLITEDTGTQGKGRVQLEAVLSFYKDKYKSNALTSSRLKRGESATCFTVGLLDSLDAVVGIPYTWYSLEENDEHVERKDGISDITFDAKWRFFEHNGWSLALKPGVSIPSGNEDKGLGAGRAGYRFFLVGTKEIESFAFHVNAGFIVNQNKFEEREDIWHASAAAEVEALKDLKLMANVGTERNPDPASENHPAFALGGIAYDISEMMTISAGIKYGLTSTETDWSYLAGLTIKF